MIRDIYRELLQTAGYRERQDIEKHACNERFLGLRLKELGLEQKRLSDGRYWKGVKVKSQTT